MPFTVDAQGNAIPYVEPARPEGRANWTPAQTAAWVQANPTTPPPLGVPADASWDPVRRDWYVNSFDYGGGEDRERSEFRQYLNQGTNPLASMYIGGSYIGPGSQLIQAEPGGRRDIYPEYPFYVPSYSIRGTLRAGDTGYRGPEPPPELATLSLAPERPLGVQEDWVWDPATRAWRPPAQVSTVVGVNTRGRNTGLGSTTETAAPRYTATPPNEVPPVAFYNHNQDGTVSPPGMVGPVGQWNFNSDQPTQPSPEDIRLAKLGYIDNRIHYAGLA